VTEGKRIQKKAGSELKAFPVPFALEEIKKDILFSNSNSSKPNKEELIERAIKFHLEGNIQEAAKLYQYCIKQGFNDPRIFANFGIILKDLSKLHDAELSQRKAIELNPNFSTAHMNLGSVLKDLGKLQEAEISIRKAIELNPDFFQAHLNLGALLKEFGKLQEAENCTRKAIELNPDFAMSHANLGSILKELGMLQGAEISTRKAIKLDSNLFEAHSNLGTILRDLDKLQEAKISLSKAIELKPDLAEAHLNMGNIQKELGDLEDSEISLRKAIDLKPDFADAYFNLSYIELLKGDYKSGLDKLEYRFKKKEPALLHCKPVIRKYDHKELRKEEKLLVISEQGLGDTIQYMRYIPYLKKQGLDVSFCAQSKLHNLIKASGIDPHPLTSLQANIVSEGRWIPLLSLAKYLRVNPNNPIITKPYINSTNELNNKWKKFLSNEKKPLIGINWQGNINIEKNYQGRSIPLEAFSRISELKNITLLSLQKGFGSEQLKNCSFKDAFVECQAKIDLTWDFLENAAIIENCDLIITCDTSIAHLAGGMGKKVWLLLRDPPFWTWGIEGETTFWYPSMRLFRQKERHNWQEVMERVSNELKTKIKR